MRSNSDKFKALNSPLFLVCLILLLVNDHFLKSNLNNWITGKLSDFCGLFVFYVFWATFFPKRKPLVGTLIALAFVYWKSPLSQQVIDSWNHINFLPLTRVVDYTDLFALLILPIAFLWEKRGSQYYSFKITPALPILISSFAFLATSYTGSETINRSYFFDVPADELVTQTNQVIIENYDSSFAGFEFNKLPQTKDVYGVPSDFCRDFIDVRISIHPVSSNRSKLVYLEANHDCPSHEGDRKKLLKEFEESFIAKIKELQNDNRNSTGSSKPIGLDIKKGICCYL